MSELKVRFQGSSQLKPTPSDNAVSFAFVMLGVMVLLPWNCSVSATSFFVSIFPDQQWPLYSTQVYQTVRMVVQVAMIFWGKKLSPWMVFVVPLLTCCVGSLAIMAVATILVHEHLCFVITLLGTALLSAAMAVLQSGLSGAAAKGTEKYGALPGKLILGMGAAGVVSMGLELLTSFFFTSLEIGFLCLFGTIAFLTLLSLHWYRVFEGVYSISSMAVDEENPSIGITQEPLGGQSDVVWTSCRSAWAGLPYEGAIFCVFAVSFMVFPAVAAKWQGSGAIPIKMYVTFVLGDYQIMDVVGRLIAMRVGHIQTLGSPVVIWMLVLARGIFIPLFFFCADGHGGVFGSQAFQMVLMALLASSNGFLASLAMQFAPRYVPAPARTAVGMVMTLGLCGGITVGSYLAKLQDQT
eukprot:gnl/MRDRNA2_/MRDRNA2_109290_c0_seq1.p1 gnl/MRDRNA2_/MRDRNA2_109290_c0~~gnl/MRDRNA2_/MRDRNA2_109290_c0_seq1.p1  ORF type:complete len:409 (-),score=42.55 gnl/MRDRNA2_/MRDRNA2_109290_c0_seq1:272-1498(-)